MHSCTFCGGIGALGVAAATVNRGVVAIWMFVCHVSTAEFFLPKMLPELLYETPCEIDYGNRNAED